MEFKDTFFNTHKCPVHSDNLSLMDCFEYCNNRDSCVGFAHRRSTCMTCNSGDGYIAANESVPLELRMGFLLEMDYLPAMTKARGRDCKHISDLGFTEDGIYWVNPDGDSEFEVFCELNPNRTDGSIGAGWTVIQRRFNDSVSFDRPWADYVDGFGNMAGNTWLGLNNIHRLVAASTRTELHIFLEAYDDTTKYAHYNEFYIEDSSDNFRLSVAGYNGTAGDSLQPSSTSHISNGQPFTTYDNDNDGRSWANCAERWGGGWWHNDCFRANLNGGNDAEGTFVIDWYTYFDDYTPLKSSVMKIRRVGSNVS